MLQPGHRLGDFEIIRLLGKGGMGEVYEAKQFHPERRVALKVLGSWLAENKDSLQRFTREAEALAKLDHPGIVRIITTGEQDGIIYYAMQLIHGVSLSTLLRLAKDTDPESCAPPAPGSTSRDATPHSLGGPDTKPYVDTPACLPQAPPLVNAYRTDRYGTVARIGLQAAQALASAHRVGLVHRDIKPSNIMLDQHDHVYLVDFGLTRSLESGAPTRAGVLVGTPWYMSPEQAANAKVDCRSDVYSLGVTLYHLATGGEGPYTADRDDTGAVLEQVRGGALVPVSDLAPTIPQGLVNILSRAMALDPARRYPNAAEMAADLKQFLQSETGSRTARVTKTHRHVRARTWLGGAAATLGVLMLVVAQLTRDPNDPGRPPELPPGEPDLFKDRVRPLNVRLPLLREDQQPDLYRILMEQETGTMEPMGKELVLRSKSKTRPFLVALDNPGNTPFEFRVELRARAEQRTPIDESRHEMGLFFGWLNKAPDPRSFPRFFVLTLDTRPILQDHHGRLTFGTWGFRAKAPGVVVPNELTPKGLNAQHWLPLPPSDGFCSVRVTVNRRDLKLELDDQMPLRFTLDEVIQKSPWLKNAHVQFEGAVGIWVRDGLGHFRNATVKALPNEVR